MEFKITKEQIDELARTNAVIKERLNEYFPEAFKKELQVGKWYKRPIGKALFFVKGVLENDSFAVYGFNKNGNWMELENSQTWHDDNDVEATDKEVSAALIAEANKRGYKEGVRIKGLASGDSRIIPDGKFEFLSHELLWFGNLDEGYDIFKCGKWAEILTQEKTVVPMEKALKIIAKKMKVSPENIEIK